ncbi:MAG: hypothetical protein EA403_07275 [Spirochaetaceae bacterium]|nr:MAG: hypothetical protein EA403_07275 [Spirochaetaceae bacterium]
MEWKALWVSAALVATALASGSCALAQPQIPVRVVVPQTSGDWPAEAIIGFRLEWYADGVQSRSVPREVDAVWLEMPKRRGVPVLIHPVTANGDRLLPAGALVPEHLSAGGVLRPTWEGGAAATIVMRIARRTGAPERYHGARLFGELTARTDGDPWRADLDAITGLLLGGTFRVTAIRARPRVPLQLAAPPGAWLRNTPTATTLPRDAEGALLVELEEGVHRLHHPQSGAVLTVSVDARGEVLTRISAQRY